MTKIPFIKRPGALMDETIDYLVFRLGIGKNTGTYFFVRTSAPYKTIIDFLAVARLSLFDDHKKSL